MNYFAEESSKVTISQVKTMALAVYPLLADHERKKIVSELFKEFNLLTPATRKHLENIFQRNLKIRGFSKFMSVPLPRRIDAVIQHSLKYEPATGLVLAGWLERKYAIYEAIRDAVQACHKPVVWGLDDQIIESARAHAQANGANGPSYVITLCEVDEAFLAAYPEMDRFDVIMAAICGEPIDADAVIEADASSAEEARVEGNDGEPWERWLAEAEILPAAHPAWQRLDSFIDDLRALAASKQQRMVERDALAAALAQLQAVDPALLASMYLQGVMAWQLPAALPESSATLLTELGDLLTQIEEYRQVAAGSENSRQERDAKWQRLSELSASSETVMWQLAPIFTAAVPVTSPLAEEAAPKEDEPREESVEEETVDATLEEESIDEESNEEESVEVELIEELTGGLAGEDDADWPQTEKPRPFALEAEQAEAFLDETEEAPDDWLDDETVAELFQETNVGNEPEVSQTTMPGPEGGEEPQLAISLRSDDDDQDLWNMVDDGDLAGAYWLAQAMVKLKKTPAIPSELLAAAQGSVWLTEEPALPYAEDLREIARHYEPDQTRIEHVLIGVAAALSPMVLSPSTELHNWLNVPPEQEWLARFVTPIRDFGFYGVGLSADVLPGVTTVAQLEERQLDVVAQANAWRTTAAQRRSNLKAAADIWHELIKSHGELSKLLQPVFDNNNAAFDTVRQELARWQDPYFVESIIEEIDRDLRRTKRHKIDGGIRDYLKRSIAEGYRHAQAWVSVTAEIRKRAQQGSDWRAQQAAKLLTHLKQSLPEVTAALVEYQSEAEPLPLRASAVVLANALRHLARMFGIEEGVMRQLPAQPFAAWAKPPYPQWATHQTESISQALNRRLLLLPAVDVSDEGAPADEAWNVIFDDIEVALERIPGLFRRWLQKQDYRFIGLLLTLHPAPEEAEKEAADAIEGSRAALQAMLLESQGRVEQAVVDGIINDAQRTEYLGQLAAVKSKVHEIKNFNAEYNRLEQLDVELSEAKQLRVAQLQQQWAELAAKLHGSFLGAPKQQTIADFLNGAMARQDTRLVEESLAHLREALESNRDLEIDDWFAPRRQSDPFDIFLGHLGDLNRFWDTGGKLSEMLTAIRGGRNLAGLEFNGVPRKRLDEATRAVEAWSRLKKSPPKPAQKIYLRGYVSEILVYLGFALTASDEDRAAAVEVDEMGTDFLTMRASLIHGDLARPIPQFGSQANGLYRIVCIWERPSIDSIVAQLTERNLTSIPVIALYLGRLTATQRRELAQSTRENRLPLALLDETLLVYLAAAHNARFPIFLRCALPYATLTPYGLQAGNVPPEIFYGRQEAIKRLSEQQGACIVYGGRQLGKSALLRQVQRGFHHPKRGDYAFFVDIKNVGDRRGDLKTIDLWAKIRDHLKEEGLLKKQITTTDPEEIVRRINTLLGDQPQTRLLFLLDEADNFLDADAQSNFQEVDRLRALMGDTNRRFRVIFAGLHNVQRFQGIPNQPLAHFGDPVAVGPLEAKAALDLVREPLTVLGFRFEDETVPLRMLSYTNYHPSLIQFFCQELLQRLYRRPTYTPPPYQISQNDVEAVYSRTDVGDRIRERFDWTLALDARYQTIAYALVEAQLASAESYGASFSIAEVLRLVQFWWADGFKEVDQSRLHGLLDEMVGLGILVRGREGGYRLRSPNLVRLMGSEADIESRLLEFSTRSAPAEYSADQFHTLLSDATTQFQYSPLTNAQERDLTRHQSGVTLLFASEAQGYYDLPATLKKLGRMDGEIAARVVEELSTVITYPDQLKKQMMEIRKNQSSAEHILLYYRVRVRADVDVYALVECAQQYCATLHNSKRCLQVIFLFDHEATAYWLAANPQRCQAIEETAAIVHPYPWHRQAICRRLEQHNKVDSEDICKLIDEVTGGWPFLLDELMHNNASEPDLRPAAKRMNTALRQPKSQLAVGFRKALGIAEESASKTLLRFAAGFMKHSDDMIEADLLALAQSENDLALTEQEFQDAIEYLVRMGCLLRSGENFTLAPLLYQLSKQL